MTPDYDISVAGRSITPTISGRLIDLTLSDKRGFEADELSLTLDDSDGLLDIPSRGAVVEVSLGFKETGFVDKGSYVVDEAGHTGPPDRLTLRARSADFHKSLNEQKRRAFRDTPLGDILKTIAGDHGLEAAIEEGLAWTNPGHIDQTDESDGHLLTRLGRLHDAVATVKAGRLLFTPMGRGSTAGGTVLPGVRIARQDGDSHSFQNLEGSSDYSGVRANWYDVASAVTKTVLAEGESDISKLKTLLETFASEAEAQTAARAEWNRIERGRYTLSLTLAIGRPDLLPETPVTLTGWKAAITDHKWICGPIEHTLNDSGLVTKVTLESSPHE